MDYRKSYYQQRQEERARITEAIRKQINPVEEPVETPAVDPVPDSSWKKSDIQLWLDDNGIEWNSSMTKSELLDLVQ